MRSKSVYEMRSYDHDEITTEDEIHIRNIENTRAIGL